MQCGLAPHKFDATFRQSQLQPGALPISCDPCSIFRNGFESPPSHRRAKVLRNQVATFDPSSQFVTSPRTSRVRVFAYANGRRWIYIICPSTGRFAIDSLVSYEYSYTVKPMTRDSETSEIREVAFFYFALVWKQLRMQRLWNSRHLLCV